MAGADPGGGGTGPEHLGDQGQRVCFPGLAWAEGRLETERIQWGNLVPAQSQVLCCAGGPSLPHRPPAPGSELEGSAPRRGRGLPGNRAAESFLALRPAAWPPEDLRGSSGASSPQARYPRSRPVLRGRLGHATLGSSASLVRAGPPQHQPESPAPSVQLCETLVGLLSNHTWCCRFEKSRSPPAQPWELSLGKPRRASVQEMRSRSNSGVRLDGYARLVQQTILCYQVRRDPTPSYTPPPPMELRDLSLMSLILLPRLLSVSSCDLRACSWEVSQSC